MFRNPRERSGIDVGRPPTPPTFSKNCGPLRPASSTMATTTTPRRMTGSTGKLEQRAQSGMKAKQSGNGSILSFFKKTEPRSETLENDLFLPPDEDSGAASKPDVPVPRVERVEQDDLRYNENRGSVKRQRTSDALLDENQETTKTGEDFVVESTVNRMNDPVTVKHEVIELEDPTAEVKIEEPSTKSTPPSTTSAEPVLRPALRRAETSIDEDLFEGMGDFDDEFPFEGEEYMERQYMEEQRMLEQEFENDDLEPTNGAGPILQQEDSFTVQQDGGITECPLCNANLSGLSSEKASIHVNGCLDGNPIPVPQTVVKKEEIKEEPKDPSTGPTYKRFQRAGIARPGQEIPFQLNGSTQGGSAFSKLMSSHAEDAAWASAAANEMNSRGKPAYKRTCPFYKIMPGFFICVDAFRYGAVEGCNAYFLSHFHSDHYIGLTSSWSHGPIYCSHVTANLVRRQLRVDPKYVVDLEFEKEVEVPGTQGVKVTMIPANHCPGSSLFLFEKVVGRGHNPRKQRILHCGDFRACPAHVQHPLLRPDVIDIAQGGKKREQKLDICYLDTTYLIPKYAFPRQEEVIKACADMCVSLSKEKIDESDDWEQVKKQRAGSGMIKFVKKEAESAETDDTSASTDGPVADTTASKKKGRGRLLVVVGTYSIGKERICLGVARALNSKIFAPPGKLRICAALEDPELSARLTGDPLEAQVHMQMLMEIRAETLADYLTGYKPHFSRIVGFRPSGWNYRPPNSRFVESPLVQTVLYSDNWKSRYSMAELVPQRGSTREASCFGVPYSEHSSFRELSMFCCALRIDKIIPTVNVGSAKSREKMKGWIEKWAQEKKKNGLYKVADDVLYW